MNQKKPSDLAKRLVDHAARNLGDVVVLEARVARLQEKLTQVPADKCRSVGCGRRPLFCDMHWNQKVDRIGELINENDLLHEKIQEAEKEAAKLSLTCGFCGKPADLCRACYDKALETKRKNDVAAIKKRGTCNEDCGRPAELCEQCSMAKMEQLEELAEAKARAEGLAAQLGAMSTQKLNIEEKLATIQFNLEADNTVGRLLDQEGEVKTLHEQLEDALTANRNLRAEPVTCSVCDNRDATMCQVCADWAVQDKIVELDRAEKKPREANGWVCKFCLVRFFENPASCPSCKRPKAEAERITAACDDEVKP